MLPKFILQTRLWDSLHMHHSADHLPKAHLHLCPGQLSQPHGPPLLLAYHYDRIIASWYFHCLRMLSMKANRESIQSHCSKWTWNSCLIIQTAIHKGTTISAHS